MFMEDLLFNGRLSGEEKTKHRCFLEKIKQFEGRAGFKSKMYYSPVAGSRIRYIFSSLRCFIWVTDYDALSVDHFSGLNKM